MNEYELLYIVSPRIAADDVPAAMERVSALVRSSGGEVLTSDNWGRRRLAYPIRRYFEGTYVLNTLQLPRAGAALLEAGLGISEEVIRHLLLAEIIAPSGRGRSPRDEERERPAEPAAPAAASEPVAAAAASEAAAPAVEPEPEPEPAVATAE